MKTLNFDNYLNELLESAQINAIKPVYKCNKCNDIGFIFNDLGAELCRCQIKAANKYPLCYAFEIDPIVFSSAEQIATGTIKLTPNQIQVLKLLTEFYHDISKKPPFLTGDKPGTGKTMLLSYLGFRVAQERNLRTQFIRTTDLKEKLQNCIQNDKPIDSVLNTLKYGIDFLIIDDLGAEKVTEFYEEQFYNLIDYRYNAKKLTGFTSNFLIDELPYTPRLKSRIHGLSSEIVLNGKDFRRD